MCFFKLAATVPKTSAAFPSSTGTTTYHSVTTTDIETTSASLIDALTSLTTTSGNDPSYTADSKTGNSFSSGKVHKMELNTMKLA